MAKRKVKFNKSTKKSTKKVEPAKIVMYPAGINDGCTAWRFDFPRLSMNYSKTAEVQLTNAIQPISVKLKGQDVINPLYINTNAVVIQRPVFDYHISLAKQLNGIQNNLKRAGRDSFRLIVDVDDVLHGNHIAKYNISRGDYVDNTRFERLKEVVKRSDDLHVCSKPMADFYREEIGFDNITVKPNLLPKFLFDGHYDLELSRLRWEKHRAKPRILWAGSWSHIDLKNINNGKDDFSEIKDFILKTKDDYQWVFYGAHPTGFEPYIKNGTFEYHEWTSIMGYAQKVRDLEPTIFLAPLTDNLFNRCKSNIKLTEAGAMGIAGVYQNLDPYFEAPLKFDNVDEIQDHFNYLLSDWDNYAKTIEDMRKTSEGYFAEDNLDMLLASYTTDVGSPMRKHISKKLVNIQ